MSGPRRKWSVVPWAVLAAVAVGLLPGCDAPPGNRVVSRFESEDPADYHVIMRDVGASVALPPMPGQPAGENWSMWLFGDTFVNEEAPNASTTTLPGHIPAGYFMVGTFAAIGPYTPGLVPQSLSEVPSPPTPFAPNDNGPSVLLPGVSGLRPPASDENCSYQATWSFGLDRGPDRDVVLAPGAAPRDGDQLVFIAGSDTCVFDADLTPSDCPDADAWDIWGLPPSGVRFTYQRTRLVAYHPATNTVVANWVPFSTTQGHCLPWQLQLFQPVFSGDYLYLFSSDCDNYNATLKACITGKVTTARVHVDNLYRLQDPTVYEWATSAVSDGWDNNYALATSVVPSQSQLGPLILDVHDFSSVGEGFVLMEQTSFGGHYNLYEATSPEGPWTLKRSGQMPGCIIGDEHEACYAVHGHPELSTTGHLMYSYVNKSKGFVTVVDLGPLEQP